MGMSIDEAIDDIHAIQHYYNDETQDGYVGFAKEDNESVDLAVATMRKFQRIQAIVEAWKADVDIDSYDCMADIEGVVEDRND